MPTSLAGRHQNDGVGMGEHYKDLSRLCVVGRVRVSASFLARTHKNRF